MMKKLMFMLALIVLTGTHGINTTTGSSIPPLKEINYYPRYYAWEQFWAQWPLAKGQMDVDLDIIQSLGANTVRIFLPPLVLGYPRPAPEYMSYFEEALALIDSHGLKAHVTLFDCWWSWNEISNSQSWLDAIVMPHQNDPRIALWELQNEVQLDIQIVRDWVQAIFPYLKQQAGNIPCTVSVGDVEWLDDLSDLTNPYTPDIHSLHWYPSGEYFWTNHFPSVIDRARQLIGQSQLLLGEFGYNTYKLSEMSQANLYRDVLYHTSQKGVTHLGAWTLFDFPVATPQCGGQVPEPDKGEEYFGLYRLDGSAKPAASILRNAFHGSPPTPGPMIILNPSFEVLNVNSGLMANWKYWDQDWSGQEIVSQDWTINRNGSCSAKVQGPGNLAVGLYTSPAFPVKSGRQYSLQGYVRTQDLNGWARIVLSWYDSNIVWLGDTSSQVITDPNSSQWIEISIDEAAPLQGAAYFQVYAQMLSDNPATCVWFDDITMPFTKEYKIKLEADYITQCQYINPQNPAHGAINNVYGDPTWVVPREIAMSILGLIVASEVLDESIYLTRAQLAADYLVTVQEPDGAWYNQYNFTSPPGTPADSDYSYEWSKSPTQTAEVMIAFHKLGYNHNRYDSMKRGAQYLMECQNTTNKLGIDDGLLGGGKKADGQYHGWRWSHDNSYAYWALKAAEDWAIFECDTAFASECAQSAQMIINGINTYLYDVTDEIWHIAIDESGTPLNNPHLDCRDHTSSPYPSWIQYAPKMLDLPVIGINSQAIGDWIMNTFRPGNDSCEGCLGYDCNESALETRKYPGFAFQAALSWFDTGHISVAEAAIAWAETSGLWQTIANDEGVAGGWIDWMDISTTIPGPGAKVAEAWQRFIDTSAYSIFCWNGGYDFSISAPFVRIEGSQALYSTIQTAYNEATNGAVIKCRTGIYAEDLDITRSGISVKLTGGHDADFSFDKGKTIIRSLTVGNCAVEVENLVIYSPCDG